MAKTRSLLSDGAWVAALQGLSALGQLIGVRMLTDVIPPSVFGEVSLWIGAVALASAAMANPTMQALLRFYPEYHEKGEGALIRFVVRAQLMRLAGVVLPIFLLGSLAVIALDHAKTSDLLILFALVVVDIARMSSTAYLNALRVYKASGIWALIEAWGRPILAYALIKEFGVDATWVLAAYLMVSIFALGLMRGHVPKDPYGKSLVLSVERRDELSSRFWRYSIPLLPLGLIGWISGMADRYMIGFLLTPADVGLYVAIYGLASRPMAMFGGIIETILRPAYQQALIEGNHKLARSYLTKWVTMIVFGSICALLITGLGHEWLAGVLIGSEYRIVSNLLPWIVGGYSLLILSHVANRVCYANEATRRVFLIELGGALLAIGVGFVCIFKYGLWGGALAVPLYYGAQLILACYFAMPWLSMKKSAE